ncbi:Calpain-10, partial [Plecturocebus cupreus]
EICATPRLFPDDPREGQVKQGLLGDCWFLCACAALQKSRHLLDQVIPPGQPSWADQEYQGSFTCRVWQFGRWVEVTTDDRLPCLAGRLCFSRCQREDVFWLPLLEKVYAKVHGSYEHLWAGQVADALVDLTGGLAERWNLKGIAGSRGQQDRPGHGEHRTCQQLLHLKDRCLISCSVLSPRAGARELGEFHAFIVSDLRELQGQGGHSILLLRIQNPWGRRCWQGLWREGGEGWSQVDVAVASELLSQLQEGEFWVEEEEFLREFDEITIGYPVTEAGHLQSLYTERPLCHTRALPGAWVKGQSAGGCRNNSGFPSNPKFWLRVSEPSEVCVAVLQRSRMHAADWAGRAQALLGDSCTSWSPAGIPGKHYQAVGLHIWKGVTLGTTLFPVPSWMWPHDVPFLLEKKVLEGPLSGSPQVAWATVPPTGRTCRLMSGTDGGPRAKCGPGQAGISSWPKRGWRALTDLGAIICAWSRKAKAPDAGLSSALGLCPSSQVEKRRVSLPRVLSAPPVAGTACHAYDREVHLRCELSAGYYLAVPSTFLKDAPGQFLLRVFSTGRISLSAIRAVAKNAAPGAVLPAGEWGTVQLRGSWRAGHTAGGSRNFASYPTNPCFPFLVPEGPGPRCIHISLHQHCQPGDTEFHPIGFHVFQASSSPRGGGNRGALREFASWPWLFQQRALGSVTWARSPSSPALQAAAWNPHGALPHLHPHTGEVEDGLWKGRGPGRVSRGGGEWGEGEKCEGDGRLSLRLAGEGQAVGLGTQEPDGLRQLAQVPQSSEENTSQGPVPEGGRSPDAPPLLLQEPLLSCVPHRYAQEVSRLCLLPAGSYRVVPSTYLPDTEGAFTVTIATKIDRPSIHSQEVLGQFLQEVSVMAVMKT